MDINPIRVIVTEEDTGGTARVSSDGPAPRIFHRDHRPVAMTDLWQISQVPARTHEDGRQKPDEPFVLAPDAGGVKFRIVQFDPEPEHTGGRTDGQNVFAEMGADSEHVNGARHPYMHRTQTVDFGIILQGSITMLLDEEDVEVSAGDVVIQRGTNHAWSNRTDQPCLVAFILADADAKPTPTH
ncbi:cupin domain-containing protein [Brevibacterium sp. BDJS002]|uniref:cupin domain-containing protein n=1 Tax=Brevibacterium sp. BDJS002 TaxID=3020906 RepID=UPI002307F09D|nr:cupin domain-containing protein [Brevibacterium sp. BDJS002]WCE41202.1 cupin domain-containing protein [Brevibacterium sp. BDJS002]